MTETEGASEPPWMLLSAYRYPVGDHNALCERLRSWLAHGAPPAPDVRAWRAEALSVHWGTLLDGLMGAKT